MHIEEFRDYCLAKPGAEECFPFGEDTLVFKANGKIFALFSLDKHPLQFNTKCQPDRALELRETYPAILPGYHMNKKLWNTVIVDGSVPKEVLIRLIDDSYSLVTRKTIT